MSFRADGSFRYDTPAWRRVRRAILDRDGRMCQIRGRKCDLEATEVDHIIPWLAGGALYDEDNLRAACATCNRSRARRDGVGATTRVRPSQEW